MQKLQTDPKIHMEIRKSQNNIQKARVGRFTIFNFKTYYKVSVIKMVWYWYTGIQIDPLNRIESPAANPYFYDQLSLDGVPKQFNGKRRAFSKNDDGKTAYSHAKE